MSLPYEGDSADPSVPGITGTNSAGGVGVSGRSIAGGIGVQGKSDGGVAGSFEGDVGVTGSLTAQNIVLGGSLSVAGAASIGNALSVTGNLTGGSLGVAGTATIDGTLGVKGEVGVGTSTPMEKLQIESGSVFVDGEGGGVIVDAQGLERVGLMKYRGFSAMLVGNSQLANPIILGRWVGGTIKRPNEVIEDLVIDPSGNVGISGSLTVMGNKGFRIDHPLNPANKYLNHFCVEGSEAKNLYDGRATLNENGEAIVELPAWFEALNKNFQYQLTPVGKFAPLYIANAVGNNRFTIAGGDPAMEVCWQVTGVRNDTYVQEHPTVLEEEKI
jgi:hypothetical protein